MRRLAVARNHGLRPIIRPRWTPAAAVAAGAVGRFHCGHHAIGDRAGGLDERLHGVWHHLTRAEDVALNGIEDLGALNLPLQMLRYVPVSQAGMPGAATLQIENAE